MAHRKAALYKQARCLLAVLIVLCGVASAQTLTLTANNVTVHKGDMVPPLNFRYSGADQWSTAIKSGQPQLTTIYTSQSPAGTYPITFVSQSPSDPNLLVPAPTYNIVRVAGTLTVKERTINGVLDTTGAIITSPPTPPADMMFDVKAKGKVKQLPAPCDQYTIMGDGKNDDTL